MARPQRRSALAAPALLVAVTLAGIVAGGSPAYAGTSMSVSVAVPSAYEVGQRGLPGSVAITNQTDGPTAAEGLTLTGILLTPACASLSVAGVCAQTDPGVVAVTQAVGETGTGCAGMPFAKLATTDPGRVVLAPALPVVLAPAGEAAATCRVDLVIGVNGVPSVDAGTAPGAQTAASASASASLPDGTKASATGTALSTVSAIPTVSAPAATTNAPAAPRRGRAVALPAVGPLAGGTSFIDAAARCCGYAGGVR